MIIKTKLQSELFIALRINQNINTTTNAANVTDALPIIILKSTPDILSRVSRKAVFRELSEEEAIYIFRICRYVDPKKRNNPGNANFKKLQNRPKKSPNTRPRNSASPYINTANSPVFKKPVQICEELLRKSETVFIAEGSSLSKIISR
jgi:hypothetical protein